MKQIRIRTCLVLLFASFPLFSLVSLSHNDEIRVYHSCEKTYVTHQQIAVGNRAILIKIGNEWFLTETLYSDAAGIYIQNLSQHAYPCTTINMPCSNCNHCVSQDLTLCPYCGKST